MIFAEPKFRALGDCYLSVEFADTIHLSENFRIQAIADALSQDRLPGVVEIVSHLRNFVVIFDRAITTFDKVMDYAKEGVAGVEVPERVESRLFRIPVWYDDPWSQATAKKYDVENNLDFVAKSNGLTKDEAIAHHTGTDFWIAATGFVPGCFWSIPLDFDLVLSAPKYRVPRDFTPARAIALAGLSTCIYPYAGPGGYQCIGRSAVEVFERSPTSELFHESGTLVRQGDRHRYYTVDPLEYEDIRDRVDGGAYEYEVGLETVDLSRYHTERSDAVDEIEAGGTA